MPSPTRQICSICERFSIQGSQTAEGATSIKPASKKGPGGTKYFHISHHFSHRRMLILGAVASALGIAMWWLISSSLRSDYLPNPYTVSVALYNLFTYGDPVSGATVQDLMLRTFSHYVPAFVLAFGLAVPFGMLIGISETAGHLSRPFLEAFRPVAPIVFGPFFLIYLGPGLGVFMIVFIGVFIPIVSQIQFGVQHIDPLVLDVAQTLGAHRWTLIRKRVIPAILPNILTGIKVAMGIGWICIIEGELILGTPGIGAMILWSSQLGLYPEMFAGIVLISVIGMLTYLVGWALEKSVTNWLGMEYESAPVTHC